MRVHYWIQIAKTGKDHTGKERIENFVYDYCGTPTPQDNVVDGELVYIGGKLSQPRLVVTSGKYKGQLLRTKD